MFSNVDIMIGIGGLGLAVATTMLCVRIPRRTHFAAKAVALALLFVCYVLFAPLEHMGIFIHLPMVAITFLYVGLCYRVTVAETLFIGIAGYTIEHISSLVNSMFSLLAPVRFAHFGENVTTGPWGYALIAVSYAITYTLAWLLLIRRMRGLSLLKNATGPIVALSAVMLVVNQIWGLTFELYGAEHVSYLLRFMQYSWNLICCVFCLCIQFGIFRISQTEQELEVARRLITQKEKQYHVSKETMDAIRRKSHNLKYELSALNAGQGQQKHIDEAMALVDSFDANIQTGSDTLDVIFGEKNLYCRQLQISFVCMIDGSKLNFMEATDQYVLFGNMIDNAINAVQKLKDPAQRSIYIDVHVEKQFLLVRTENAFEETLYFRNGLPITTSGNEEDHGFGMTSIRIIAEKYGGSVSVRAEDNVFYLNILFPLG
jgi:hypothetical protein